MPASPTRTRNPTTGSSRLCALSLENCGMSDYVPSCILLTGGAGFIAGHVALRLVKQYPQYKVCARKLPTIKSVTPREDVSNASAASAYWFRRYCLIIFWNAS